MNFLRSHLRTLVTAFFAIAALGYCWTQIDWRTFLQALGTIDYVQFGLFMVVFVVAMLACDAFAMTAIFRQTIGKTKFRDIFTLRGASYLPSILNYHLGQAMFTWFLSRTHKAPVWRVAGATLLSYGSTLGALVVASTASFALRPAAFPWLGPVLAFAAVAGGLYLLMLHVGGDFAARFESSKVLLEAGLWGHVRAILVRLPHTAVLVVGSWVPFQFFGVHVPVIDALALMPIILLVGALPLTPQGLGTREVVAIELLGSYAPGTPEEGAARITACCLCWAFAFTLMEVVISLIATPAAHRLVPAAAPVKP